MALQRHHWPLENHLKPQPASTHNTKQIVLGARRVRAAALFCPPVEEPEREAGPAAMGHPPWGSEHGLYVVVVDAGGALMGREPKLQLPWNMRLKVHDRAWGCHGLVR